MNSHSLYLRVLFSVGSSGFIAPNGLVFILSVATVSFLFGYSYMNTFIFYTETIQGCDLSASNKEETLALHIWI